MTSVSAWTGEHEIIKLSILSDHQAPSQRCRWSDRASMSDSPTRPVLLIDDEGELFTTLIVLEMILTAMHRLEKDG